MADNPDHDREEVPGRPAVSSENTREQAKEGRERRAEEGRGDPTTRLRLFVRRLFGGREWSRWRTGGGGGSAEGRHETPASWPGPRAGGLRARLPEGRDIPRPRKPPGAPGEVGGGAIASPHACEIRGSAFSEVRSQDAAQPWPVA
jgi:hypothetical protein